MNFKYLSAIPIILTFMLNMCMVSGAYATETIYISTSGHDENNGSRQSPFATLEGARNAIRVMKAGKGLPEGGVTVLIESGRYFRDKSFELDQRDSGESGKPVVYRSQSGDVKDVQLNGGRIIDSWAAVTDADMLQLIPDIARGKVLVADLSGLGIREIPDFNPYCVWTQDNRRRQINPNGLWLSFRGKAMKLASWPNEGWGDSISEIAQIPGQMGEFRGQPRNMVGQFFVNRERAKKWAKETGLWCRGYFAVTYADDNQRVKRIDGNSGLIELEPPYHSYGYKKSNPNHHGAHSTYTIANALSELDQPGEFRIDFENRKIYFWPTEPLVTGDAQIPLLDTPMIQVKNATHITFHGITLENARSAGVVIDKGNDVTFQKCAIRNFGNLGFKITGGKNHTIIGCDISELASSGVEITGGDRKTLTGCGHIVDNSHIHRIGLWERTYKTAVNVTGVGVTVKNCLINDLPHAALIFKGNDNIFTHNEIHSVGRETTEVGAIYTGRSWTFYGNQIDYNYIHDIYGPHKGSGRGIHLDDSVSGISFYGNIFQNVPVGIFQAGGRSIKIRNNLFVDCGSSAIDIAYRPDLTRKIENLPYQQPPWSTRFPELVNIINEEPGLPRYGEVTNNISLGSKLIVWSKGIDLIRDCIQVDKNYWSLTEHAGIVQTSASRSIEMPGQAIRTSEFKPLPFDRMGLQPSELRASWPVDNQLSPKPRAWLEHEDKQLPVVQAVKANGKITIDGKVTDDEWVDDRFEETWGKNPNDHFILNQTIDGMKTSMTSAGRIRHDRDFLYIAMVNMVDSRKPIMMGNQWGRCDAVEIAMQSRNARNQPETLVYRGFASGDFVSSNEAGASEKMIQDSQIGVSYKAVVESNDAWSCEWKIPWKSLGIQPALNREIPFNVTVRKTASQEWVTWSPTRSHTWRVDLSGQLRLIDK